MKKNVQALPTVNLANHNTITNNPKISSLTQLKNKHLGANSIPPDPSASSGIANSNLSINDVAIIEQRKECEKEQY